MKVKYLFGALVLPALITACTNDVFEQVQEPALDNSVLKDRVKGVVTLNAEKAGVDDDAATRVEGVQQGNGIGWQWMDKNDKLGAVVVDYATKNNIVDLTNYPAYVITNYPFAPQIEQPSGAANFATPTAVVDGAYMFYSQYDGANTSRRTISHALPRTQYVDAGWEEGLKQVGSSSYTNSKGVVTKGQNFFVSPIINLAIADESKVERPLSMTSAHAMLHLQFKSDVEQQYYNMEKGFQIFKVVVRTMKSGDKFKLAQTLNPKAIENIQQAVKTAQPTLAIDAPDASGEGNYAILGMNADSKDAIDQVIYAIQSKDRDGNMLSANTVSAISEYSANAADNTEDLVYQLNTPFSFKSANDVFDLLVVFPEGTYEAETVAKSYQGRNVGALHLTIYTSEGTYDEYIGPRVAGNKITAHRGEKINVRNRKFIIKGGETNINLFDPNEGFSIETTKDYNYVIDYINAHYRDFGNTSSWKTPILEFTEGAEVTVDANHYFPSFPVKYLGNATLNLKGDKSYVFEPKNVILGKGSSTSRPTLKIEDEDATIYFNDDVKTDAALGTDGETYTAAVKLDSKATVVVAESKEVNFELLTSNTKLDINKKAVVKASGNVTTMGIVSLNEEAKLIADAKFDNSAVMTIAKKAVATLNAASTNAGTITVEGLGELKADGASATFENNGNVIVESCDIQNMNSVDRAKAAFKALTNAGEITIQASVQYKGTYGGLLTVETLNNIGAISNNGEMKVTNFVTNSGTITLESDPYALLDIKAGTLTDAVSGKGSVVLADATTYEMFDSYYTGRNDLNGNPDGSVSGVIETALNQEAYDKVLANNTRYTAAGQQTAWGVLNKIALNGKVNVTEVGNKKVVVLPAGAELVAAADITVKDLVAEGGEATVSGAKTVTLAGVLNVKKGATLENSASVKLPVSTSDVITVAGKLVNKGYMDTEGSTGVTPNNIYTSIAATGELVNEGKMSMPAARQYDENSANFNTVKFFIDQLGADLKGTVDYRIEVDASGFNWDGDLTDSEVITPDILKEILDGTWQNVNSSGFYGLTKQIGAKFYALYLNTVNATTQTPEIVALIEESKAATSPANRSMYTQIVENVVDGTAFTFVRKTWFKIDNQGTLDLLKAAADINSWAYGESVNGASATKKGKFSNEY